MRHRQKTKQLSRERNVRRALLKTLAVSLIKNSKIKTTETKAKALRPIVERLITRTKIGSIKTKALKDLAIKYKDRRGGYLRITKLNDRKNDGARMAQIEFI